MVGAEVWLVGRFGVAGSAWFAALLGLSAAACALRLSARTGETHATYLAALTARRTVLSSRSDGPLHHVRRWSLLVCSCLSGGTLLALEVVWFRFLTMYVLSTTLAASLMLAVVLAAIGLGGLSAAAWLRRSPHAATHLPVVALAAGCAVVASYAAFDVLTTGTQIAAWSRVLWLACVLTLPVSLLSGILFTLLGDALQREVVVDTRAAGWLTMTNTAGAMCGPILAAFVMLPALGMEGAFFALAAAYLAIGVLALAGIESWSASMRSPAFAVGGIALVAALGGFPFGLMDEVYFVRVAQAYADDGSQIVATREGPSETIFLMQQMWMDEPVYTRLVTNGFSMSGTAVPGMRYMRYFVYWPMALHRGPIENVLVICYGVGATAGAALDLPGVESVDVVEISRDVVAVSDAIYPSVYPLRDPRVRVHIEDGRQFLQTTSQRFDLITGEPPPPRTPGAVNIYTREYFQLTYDRLAGGRHHHLLASRRPPRPRHERQHDRSWRSVTCSTIARSGTPPRVDLMLVGTRGATGPASVAEFAAPWGHPGVAFPPRRSWSGAAATGRGDLPRRRGISARADGTHGAARRQPSPGGCALCRASRRCLIRSTPRSPRCVDSLIDPARARQAFATSDLIRRLWPEALIAATLPYFDHQRMLNRVLWDGGRPLAQIENLHWLLTETPLQHAAVLDPWAATTSRSALPDGVTTGRVPQSTRAG